MIRSLPTLLLVGTLATLVPTCSNHIERHPADRVSHWIAGLQSAHHKIKGRYGSLEELLQLEAEMRQSDPIWMAPYEANWYHVKVGPVPGGDSYEDGWHLFIWPRLEEVARLTRDAGGTPHTWYLGARSEEEPLTELYAAHLPYLGHPEGPVPGDGMLDEKGVPLPDRWGESMSAPTPEVRALHQAADRRAFWGLVIGLSASGVLGLILGIWAPSYLLLLGAIVIFPAGYQLGDVYLAGIGLAAYLPAAVGGAAVRHRNGILGGLAVLALVGAIPLTIWLQPKHELETRVRAVVARVENGS